MKAFKVLKKQKHIYIYFLPRDDGRIFTIPTPRQIQSIGCKICLSVCVIGQDPDRLPWRLQVKERIGKIVKVITPLGCRRF